jgi:hypothetical protein
MHKRQQERGGFITMIVIIVALLVLAIGFAYIRVANANG